MIEAQVQSTATGAIVFDPSLGVVPGEEWFEHSHWIGLGRASSERGGRGEVTFVDSPVGMCALRHYRRGGFAARFSADRYLWTSAERTRAFSEFRLLAQLSNAGLPVPAPIAARYERQGMTYHADLLTRRIASTRTLAVCSQEGALGPALGEAVGRTIARFHVAGVWHADLNAHNILVDEHEMVWLLDFDRGRIRTPRAAWRRANLARLRRSFAKVGAQQVAGFDERFWLPLIAAYRAGLAQVASEAQTLGTSS